jgi:hypothetical protein
MKMNLLKTVSFLAIGTMIAGCSKQPETEKTSAQNHVELVAQGMSFSGPDTIPPGWTTFHLRNTSGMVHFAVFERMPEGYGLADQQSQIAPVFQTGMDLLNAGDPAAAMEAFGKLPPWFGQIEFTGGPGFISPAMTAVTTVYLQPGKYLLECYVKTGGRFHSFNPAQIGMVHEFTVPDTLPETTAPPTADIRVRISAESGFEIEGTLQSGPQTIAVEFLDQKAHEHFLGHDIHLAQLTEDTDLLKVADWMNWTLPSGLETPAPVRFLGGVHEMPAGQVGYFSVNVERGSFAFIAEVPDPLAKKMLQVVTVP